jgi:hypothetical protein
MEGNHLVLLHFFQQPGDHFPGGVQVVRNLLMREMNMASVFLRLLPKVPFQALVHILERYVIDDDQQFLEP